MPPWAAAEALPYLGTTYYADRRVTDTLVTLPRLLDAIAAVHPHATRHHAGTILLSHPHISVARPRTRNLAQERDLSRESIVTTLIDVLTYDKRRNDNIDGAVVFDGDRIIGTGYIIGGNFDDYLKDVLHMPDVTTHEELGYVSDLGTRHEAGIRASYYLQRLVGPRAFSVVLNSRGQVRAFQDGRVVLSPYETEPERTTRVRYAYEHVVPFPLRQQPDGHEPPPAKSCQLYSFVPRMQPASPQHELG